MFLTPTQKKKNQVEIQKKNTHLWLNLVITRFSTDFDLVHFEPKHKEKSSSVTIYATCKEKTDRS